MVAQGRSCIAQSDDFSVRRRISIGEIPVPSASDDFSIADNHRTDRNLASLQCTLGHAERFFHP